MNGMSTIERAFELARDSKCRDLADVKRRLTAEGHSGVEQHLAGLSIKKQIKSIIGHRT
jgi:hypothetical protein